ncbi:MAG: SsrA-binding protein SmpB [Candidatus Izemoplasmataceae bacterium]
MSVIARNKKATHDYFILETYEAGIVLTGTEIKSIRAGKVNLKDAYIRTTKSNEAYIINMHIAKFKQGNRFNHEETRERKLLLHKHEILKLRQKAMQEAATIVPIKLYILKGKAKLEIALAKGKKKYDKRRDLKEKAMKRDVEKALKDRAR